MDCHDHSVCCNFVSRLSTNGIIKCKLWWPQSSITVISPLTWALFFCPISIQSYYKRILLVDMKVTRTNVRKIFCLFTLMTYLSRLAAAAIREKKEKKTCHSILSTWSFKVPIFLMVHHIISKRIIIIIMR